MSLKKPIIVANGLAMKNNLKPGDTVRFHKSMSKKVKLDKEYKVVYVSHDFKVGRGVFEIMVSRRKAWLIRKYDQRYGWDILKN